MQADGHFDGVYRRRDRIVVFVPTAEEFERFERASAFLELARMFDVTCVVPPDVVETRGAAAARLRPIEIVELRLEDGGKEKWRQLFPPVPHPLVWSRNLRRVCSWMMHAILGVGAPVRKGLSRGLLWLAQVPFLSLRARRLILAAATFEPSEDFAFSPGGDHPADSPLRAARPPADAVVEILQRTRPLFVLLATEFRDPWYPDVVSSCEAHDTPCLVLETGWRAAGHVRGTPPVVWCRRDGMVETCSASLLPEVLATLPRPRRDPLDARNCNRQLTSLCLDVAAPYARRVRRLRGAHLRGHISRAYGADHAARTYAGVSDQNARVPGYWMHGWLPAFHNVDPALIALHKQDRQGPRHDFDAQIRREKREIAQWVSRADQAKYLTRQGYRNVSAIGLPIVYVPPVRVRRMPGSLLVMPPHGHMSHGPGDPIAKAYTSAIADIRGAFDRVVVCLSREDLEAQQWADFYRGGDFEVFSAVDPYQPDALFQLKRLLRSFEFVTTNGFGSHIAYAAYCGARVSVFGPFAAMPIERMARTHAVRMFPELLGKAYELCLEAPLRRHYPFLFVDPDKAVVNTQWGAHEVGEPCKAAPDELAQLFGWISPPPALGATLAMAQS